MTHWLNSLIYFFFFFFPSLILLGKYFSQLSKDCQFIQIFCLHPFPAVKKYVGSFDLLGNAFKFKSYLFTISMIYEVKSAKSNYVLHSISTAWLLSQGDDLQLLVLRDVDQGRVTCGRSTPGRWVFATVARQRKYWSKAGAKWRHSIITDIFMMRHDLKLLSYCCITRLNT